jgi:hypothetical protein
MLHSSGTAMQLLARFSLLVTTASSTLQQQQQQHKTRSGLSIIRLAAAAAGAWPMLAGMTLPACASCLHTVAIATHASHFMPFLPPNVITSKYVSFY